MRITNVEEATIPLSRYSDAALPSQGLTTSLVVVTTDVMRHGKFVKGAGFASVGRYAQGGLIRGRFAPRLVQASSPDLLNDEGANIDPFRAHAVMMKGEKPGGHGERCVAVGTLDMAIWDAAAKIEELPLYRFIEKKIGRTTPPSERVRVYAGGGYVYPADDLQRLASEMKRCVDLGFNEVKIKVGSLPLEDDLKRIETTANCLGQPASVAVDAMNAYAPEEALLAAQAFAPMALRWFEDACDPHDFDTQAAIARIYDPPLAAGEALFSQQEAKLLGRYGGLRREKDALLFDPVHCYGLTAYIQIVEFFARQGWPLRAFWPHGGHLFSLHIVAALALGGAEVNPFAFAPFRGLYDGAKIASGHVAPPQRPGIGFESNSEIWQVFRNLFAGC